MSKLMGLLCCAVWFLAPCAALAQAPAWHETFGDGVGSHFGGEDAVLMADGGHVVAGFHRPVETRHAMAMRIGPTGAVLWQKSFAAPDGWNSKAHRIVVTADGYVLFGRHESPDQTRSLPFILALDAAGAVRWAARFPLDGIADSAPLGHALAALPDGGVVAGVRHYVGEEIVTWLLRLDAAGGLVWQRRIAAFFNDVHAGSDGGAIVAATPRCLAGGCIAHLMRLDAGGTVEWQRSYGLADGRSLQIRTVRATAGGYVVGGTFDEDVSGEEEAVLWKVDASGALLWTRAFSADRCTGGFEGVRTVHENAQGFLLRLDSGCTKMGVAQVDTEGTLAWNRWIGTLQPRGMMSGDALAPLQGGGFLALGGWTDLSGGEADFSVLKSSPDGRALRCGLRILPYGLQAIAPPAIVVAGSDLVQVPTAVEAESVPLVTTALAVPAVDVCRP